MKRTKLVVKRKLKKLAKANRVLKNENITKIFEKIIESGIISRIDLGGITQLRESSISKYLSRLEAADLVLLNQPCPYGAWEKHVRYEHRSKFIKISPYGRQLSETMGTPIPKRITLVASEINRIFILETIANEDDGLTTTELNLSLNRLLREYRLREVTTYLLDYHMGILKKESQITPESPYALALDGEKTVKVVDDMVGHPIYIK